MIYQILLTKRTIRPDGVSVGQCTILYKDTPLSEERIRELLKDYLAPDCEIRLAVVKSEVVVNVSINDLSVDLSTER